METTAKQFNFFKKEVEKWIKKFGLINWDITIWHSEDVSVDAAADCACDFGQHYATVRLQKNIEEGDCFTNKNIKRYAFHEVMHIFLYRIQYLADCRYIDNVEIPEEIHSLIRTLENVILK